LGFLSYLRVQNYLSAELSSAYFLIIIGVLVILGGIYAAVMASRRNPRA
jgi:hypothetical protein